jgi:hypothetical protein
VVDVEQGYYTSDSGDGDVHCFFMNGEPPSGQFAFRGGVWQPLEVYGLQDGRLVTLVDGYYVMDRIIDGDPDYDGPFDDPPEGVPPFEAPAGDEPPLAQYIFLDATGSRWSHRASPLPPGRTIPRPRSSRETVDGGPQVCIEHPQPAHR